MVMPSIDKRQASFVLRQCLSKDIEKSIASCDDIENILQRLDDRYVDPGTVIDSIINEIRRFKGIDGRDNKWSIEFINLVELGYRDSKALKLENEICNANVLSLIESKLIKGLALKWYREIHKEGSIIDNVNKFPHMLRYLQNERRALKYGLSELRLSNEFKYERINEINVPLPPEYKFSNREKCLLHSNGSHVTSECREYLDMPIKEKFNLLH